MTRGLPCSNNHRWSKVAENRPSDHRGSSVEQHDSDTCCIPEHSRNLVKLRHLDLDLGLLLFLLKNVAEIPS